MMKRIFFLILPLFAALSGAGAAREWTTLCPAIEREISVPAFPDRTFSIVDYGAVPDDPKALNHGAIGRAIEACHEAGGGRVLIPAGVWHTGPLTLRSGVDLYLEAGATLLFATDPALYPPVLTRWEGIDCYNLHPLIYAYVERNIAVTGKGEIDGGAGPDNWWPMKGQTRYGWREGMVSQRTGRPKLLEWSERNVPVEERVLTPEDGLRPQLINFYRCENVLIEDVTLTRSPFWVIHPLMCTGLTVRGVQIHTFGGPNCDGCDPESCRNVLIENCFFDTGDDCIAIKSGRNADGRRAGLPSENIIVRDCRMKNGHGGVVIGSEISGGFRNLFVERCTMDSPELERVIRIKTNDCRGGVIENIFVRDVEVGRCKEAVLKVNLNYEPEEKCSRGYFPVVRNIRMERVHCGESRYGVLIDAYADRLNVSDIRIEECRWDRVPEGNRVIGQTRNIEYRNLRIDGKTVE